MKNFDTLQNKEFVLAKFQPGNILLINRYNKKAYNYFQLSQSQAISHQLTHASLLRPMIYGTGLLYPKADTNLKIQLENRKRAFNIQYFSESELCNTFIPLFQCLQYLHSQRLVHGQINPEQIVLIDGEIKLRDWLVKLEANPYYMGKKKQNRKENEDYQALGQILMQYATLRKSDDVFEERDVDLALQSIVDVYSKNMIFALLILMKGKTQLFNEVISILQKQSRIVETHSELNNYFNKIKQEKVKKLIKPLQKKTNIPQSTPTPKKIQKFSNFLQTSPNNVNKKFNITDRGTVKKTSTKLDDTQNKKVFNQQVKKRQIQKITKIIEKSNAFVNELMAKKNSSEHTNGQQVLKRISGKNNISNMNHLAMTNTNFTNMSNLSMLYAVEPNKKMKEMNGGVTSSLVMTGSITSSPNKRMRTISKKK